MSVETESRPTANVDVQKPKKEEPAEAWWINGAFVILTHLVALYAWFFYKPKTETLWLTYWCWQLATLGITMGYHRLWSHKAYDASPPLRLALAIMGTLGFQGSIKWWVLRHRLHHRFTDTEHDPYNAKRGFWFSHMGWIFQKPHYQRMKLIDASDLNADPVVRFQHKYFPFLAFGFGFIAPTIIGFAWGDALGAYLYGGFIARVFIWHVTFCINSFAHWTGDQLYSTEMSARGNLLLALMTNGEGYHNFHHEFPKDYRNGIEPLDWDPTKWLIWISSKLGLAWNLFTVDQAEIEKAKVQVMEQKAAALRKELPWGPDPESLPKLSVAEFRKRAADAGGNGCLIVLDGYILDISKFRDEHPGGIKILDAYHGKDATKAFYGILNNHSQSARTQTRMLRVGRLEGSLSAEQVEL
ncbi:hypothetical protein BJ742DRAFT_790218 [Cladochytrium replicatum]|nr:hypothetical protein BJ742DRAFT_790218 [Cladochytrium replicatum]